VKKYYKDVLLDVFIHRQDSMQCSDISRTMYQPSTCIN